MEEDGISNVYIDKLMNKISTSFHGTFSIDNIPEIDNDVFSIIINLSKHYEKGTHFIAIYSLKDKILYFDSFGMPIELSLRNYLKNYKNKLLVQCFGYRTYSVIIVDFSVFHLLCALKTI